MCKSVQEIVRIERGELNSPLCNMFRDTLTDGVTANPKFNERNDQAAIKDKDSNRPFELPEDSVFLYAETGPKDNPVIMGSICLVVWQLSSPHYKGLPQELDRVGEIKRTIVLEEFRRNGLAAKLLKALEEIARNELDLKYLVVETWWELKAGMALYESFRYERREPWGSYDARDSCCYGKWLGNDGQTV